MTPTLHGYLVIDKPAGWTSHDVVGRLRRLLRERKIGHAGTLDPAATGVLTVAVGDATKTLEYLVDSSKSYLAEIMFGVETDSYDADGVVTRTVDDCNMDVSTIEAALISLLGPQQQIPPMHSAVKIGGQRLYEAARAGKVVDRPPRPVTFHALDLLEWHPPVARIWVDCSKGTYIRTLAFDLGRMLGCGAHLSNLVRMRSGPFALESAWTLDSLAAIADLGTGVLHEFWPQIAVHPDEALLDLPAVILSSGDSLRWQQGGTVPREPFETLLDEPPTAVRAYAGSGNWLGIGELSASGQGWSPTKVIQAVDDPRAEQAVGDTEVQADDPLRTAG